VLLSKVRSKADSLQAELDMLREDVDRKLADLAKRHEATVADLHDKGRDEAALRQAAERKLVDLGAD